MLYIHGISTILVYQLFPCGRNEVPCLRPYHFLENTNRWRWSNSLTRLGPLWNYVNLCQQTRYTSRTPNLHPKALWLRWKQTEPMFYLFTWRLPAFLTTSQRHSAIQARLQVVSPVPSPAVWELCSKPRDPFIKEQVSALNSGQILPYTLYPGFCRTLVRDYRYTLLNKLTVAMVLLWCCYDVAMLEIQLPCET